MSKVNIIETRLIVEEPSEPDIWVPQFLRRILRRLGFMDPLPPPKMAYKLWADDGRVALYPVSQELLEDAAFDVEAYVRRIAIEEMYGKPLASPTDARVRVCKCGHEMAQHRGDGVCLSCGCGDDDSNPLVPLDAVRELREALANSQIALGHLLAASRPYLVTGRWSPDDLWTLASDVRHEALSALSNFSDQEQGS